MSGAQDRYDQLQRVLGAPGDDTQTVERLCLAAIEHLAVSGAGVSVVTDSGDRGILYASDEVSETIERLQVTLGEGPCVDAWRHRLPVFEPDLARSRDTRWPGFTPAARAAGAAAVFSLPLQVGRNRLGALDVYRDEPGELSAHDVHDALRLGDSVTQVLLRTRPVKDGASDPEEDGFGIEVYQASGMVMVQLDVRVQEAMARLRAYAFAEDRTLHDVARDVVERRIRMERDR